MTKHACVVALLLSTTAVADDGVERTTYSDGKPHTEITRKAGVKHGVQTLWTVGGGRSTTTFVGGVEHGPAAAFYDNGNKMHEGQYTWRGGARWQGGALPARAEHPLEEPGTRRRARLSALYSDASSEAQWVANR